MKKFKDSFNGLVIAYKHHAVKIQLVLAVLAIIGALIVKLDYYEWLVYIFCIFLVIISEIFNTAIERIGDYLNIKEDDKIKQIKDLASAGVLTSAICAIVILFFILIRRIFI